MAAWASAAAFAADVATSVNSAAKSRPQIGDKLAHCEFTDIRFLPRTLSDFVSEKDPVQKRAFVLVFTNTTCPIVQRFMPRLKQLNSEFYDQGVQFIAVDVGPDDSLIEIATQAVEHDMPFPFVKDIDGSCVAACGVERTAAAVLVDADYKLRYRGRIDSSYRLGGAAPGSVRSELRDAIRSLLAGEEIAIRETPIDGCAITKPATVKQAGEISYARQIAPILERNCNACHRPGTSAPFALMSYDDVAANAAMIAEVVEQRRMPPWFASPGIGKFTNDRTMPSADRKLLLAWAHAGAPHDDLSLPQGEGQGEGNSGNGETPTISATPDQSNTVDVDSNDPWAGKEWQMGEPDLILEAPFTYSVPADGYVDYKYTLLPTVFLHDTYLEAVEVQPSNPRAVHHSNLGYMPIGTQGMYARLITGYVPGVGPMQLDKGVASKIPAGSVAGLQIHLVTTGKPEKTRLRVGFRYPRYKVEKELHYLQLSNRRFAIPPYAAHYPVSRTKTLNDDVTIYGFFVHMHVRGQDMTFRAYPPGADPSTLLMIPNYSFDWQMPYHVAPGAAKFPAGTRYECVAHYDNTSFNPFNPDPSATVRDGQQTYQEMMYGYVFYTKDKEQLNMEINTKSGRPK
ncbi:MAG: redoxin domain-containing protein [Pirellulales bacterium]